MRPCTKATEVNWKYKIKNTWNIRWVGRLHGPSSSKIPHFSLLDFSGIWIIISQTFKRL